MPVASGSTVGSMILYGDDNTVTYSVYSVDLTTGTPTLLGSGTVGTSLDFVDYTATLNDYLLVRVDVADPTGDTIFGGVLDDAGGTPSLRLSPDRFLVNDD